MDKTSNNYIDSDLLDEEMKTYKSTGVISEKLGKMILDLHDHILQHRNFRGYRIELKEEMKGYSLLRIVKNGLRSFDPSRGFKAFSYLTRAIFCNYITILGKYYRKLNNHQKWVKNELAQLPPNHPAWKKFAKDFGLSQGQDVVNMVEV